MAEVLIDGEKVCFEGPEPADLATLITYLSRALAEQDRCLTGCIVDGVDYLEIAERAKGLEFRSVKATTSRVSEVIVDSIDHLVEEAEGLAVDLEALASFLLAHPWSEGLERLQKETERLRPLIDLFMMIRQSGNEGECSWEEQLEALEEDLQSRMVEIFEAAEKAEVAVVSDRILLDLVPVVGRTVWMLRGSIRPCFATASD